MREFGEVKSFSSDAPSGTLTLISSTSSNAVYKSTKPCWVTISSRGGKDIDTYGIMSVSIVNPSGVTCELKACTSTDGTIGTGY